MYNENREDILKYRKEIEKLKERPKKISRMSDTKFLILHFIMVMGSIVLGFSGYKWAMLIAGILTVVPIIIITVDRWRNPDEYFDEYFGCNDDIIEFVSSPAYSDFDVNIWHDEEKQD